MEAVPYPLWSSCGSKPEDDGHDHDRPRRRPSSWKRMRVAIDRMMCCVVVHIHIHTWNGSVWVHHRLSLTRTPKIQDSFVLWVALQTKDSIHIRHLLQQQDLKENHFCKWVFIRENVHIWIVPLRQPKIDLPYRYSVVAPFAGLNFSWNWLKNTVPAELL